MQQQQPNNNNSTSAAVAPLLLHQRHYHHQHTKSEPSSSVSSLGHLAEDVLTTSPVHSEGYHSATDKADEAITPE